MRMALILLCSLATTSCASNAYPWAPTKPESFAGSRWRQVTYDLHGSVKRKQLAFSSLYAFGGPPQDGAVPSSGFVNVDGVFYGTTFDGGTNNLGSIFKVTPAGSETMLYSFKGGLDGANPSGTLVAIGNTLYGTTVIGGKPSCPDSGAGCGTVFAITTSGQERVLHAFNGGTDGEGVFAGLIESGGVLYGTTGSGGDVSCPNGTLGCGTIFRITPSGDETVIYAFKGRKDGAFPQASLVEFGGSLFGTTGMGGSDDAGTVFKISSGGREKVLHSFQTSDGYQPLAPLTRFKKKFYGTTSLGGATGNGTVFQITESGNTKAIYSFVGGSNDGSYPTAPLTVYKGLLYGDTLRGGTGDGIVFKITVSGVEHVLHIFQGDDGAQPSTPLFLLDRILYGTTQLGGTAKKGTMFSLGP